VRTPGVKLEVRVPRPVLSGRAAGEYCAVGGLAHRAKLLDSEATALPASPKSEIAKSEIYFRASCNATIWSATARRIVSRRGMPAAFSGLSASKPSAGNRAPPSV